MTQVFKAREMFDEGGSDLSGRFRGGRNLARVSYFLANRNSLKKS